MESEVMEYNIAYSSSDAYAKCTGVSILSLLENNKDVETLNIFLFTTDISDQNKKSLFEISDHYNRKLTIIDINERIELIAQKYNLKPMRGGYNTYVRLYCSVWLDELNKVLFIDSDTLVIGSIKEFYNVNMEDNLVAAVPEAGVYGRATSVEDIEIVRNCNKYINAGIMLINLDQWRTENTNDVVAKKIRIYNKEWDNQEQSIFNYALSDRFKYVHLRYNYYTSFHFESYEDINKHTDVGKVFLKEEYEEAKMKPIILHFIGVPYVRPWYANNISPFSDLYLSYYKKSPYNSLPLESFPRNPQFGYRIYDYLLYITLKYNWKRLHNIVRSLFGEKLKKYLRFLVGKRI
jgi:lipopolysaccharide biosynthesis glycosyltransferase